MTNTSLRFSIVFPALLPLLVGVLFRTPGWAQTTASLQAGPEVKSILDQARIALQSGNKTLALTNYDKALAKARELRDGKGEVESLWGIGGVRRSMNEPQQALTAYQGAVDAAQRIGDIQAQCDLLTNIANIHAGEGRYSLAVSTMDRKIELCKSSGNKSGEADGHNTTGIILSESGQPHQAIERYQRGQAIFHSLGDKSGEAGALSNIGLALVELGQPQSALTHYEKALGMHRQTGNRQFEANTLNGMGVAYRNTSQTKRAMELHDQALRLFRVLGFRRGEANALTNIGLVYSDTGQPMQALTQFQQAHGIYASVGYRRGEANALSNLGMSHLDAGDPQKALHFHNQALGMFRAIADKRGEAGSLTNISAICLDAGQAERASGLLNEALPLYRAVGNKRGEAIALLGLGKAQAASGMPLEALDHYQIALSQFHSNGNVRSEADALYNIARAERQLNRMQDAETHSTQAVALLETFRGRLGGYTEAKSTFLASRLNVLRFHVSLLLERSKVTEAFNMAQKAKGRSLIDLLASGRVEFGSELTLEERSREQQLRQQANVLNTQMIREGVENEVGSKTRFAALQGKLSVAERDLQAFTDTLYARHPALAQKRVARTVTLNEIASFLPADTALMDYIMVSADEAHLFVVTILQGKPFVKSYRVQGTSGSLAELARSFHSACSDPHSNYQKQSEALYRLLIGPASSTLTSAKRLIICPDGPLWDVPFQALSSGQGAMKFLAQRYEIVYAYSATGAQAAVTRHEGRKVHERTLLALANPDFGNEKRFGDVAGLDGQRPIDAPSRPLDAPSRPLDAASRAFDAVSREGRITPLPGTQREAEALKLRFSSGSIYTGSKAQETIVKRDAAKYRYLHFATHGFVNDASPLLSSVVLAQPLRGCNEDGLLTARELFDMKLTAEMTVLSACNTARGVVRNGDGIIGLTWALFVAGCPTQVVSQWAVDDASTATTMERFYSNLVLKKMSKGTALREASLLILRDPKRVHPYYWAPFVVMGDWR